MLSPEPAAVPNSILRVEELRMHFPVSRGFLGRVSHHVKAVDGVSFTLARGETLGLVGESGCGKTTLGRMLMRLYTPTSGQIWFQPDAESEPHPLATMSQGELRAVRHHFQMIFQDPYSSLNPRQNIMDIVGEPVRLQGQSNRKEMQERVLEMLRLVGLRPEFATRFPHAFSGGQRQRIGIARALILHPALVIADEPVSALDVSVQAQILNLLKYLQQQLDLTYIFIAHDLSVVKHICSRVAVMYVGKLVEVAAVDHIFVRPRHPYSEALLSAVHSPDPDREAQRTRIVLEGDVADPAHPPSGCYFHPRCRYVQDVCRTEAPVLQDVVPGHRVACHFAADLELIGAEI